MTSLNPSMRVGLQVDEAIIRHLVLGRRKACELALSLLQKVGIADPEQVHACYPHQLSGGLRQRVMIAMALACRPRLIIADEPTTALDATTQLKVLTLLRDLQREMGTALVFITHDLGVVGRIADRVVVMYAGEIVEDGSRDQVLSAPSHPYTSALMRCIPHPGVTPPRSRLGALPGTVAPATTGRAGCGFLGRCAAAEPRCSESPAIRDVERGHRVRCHLGVPWRSDTARQKIAG